MTTSSNAATTSLQGASAGDEHWMREALALAEALNAVADRWWLV